MNFLEAYKDVLKNNTEYCIENENICIIKDDSKVCFTDRYGNLKIHPLLINNQDNAWMLIEENKSLSDYILKNDKSLGMEICVLEVSKVKESLKKFLKLIELTDDEDGNKYIKKTAKKIFGGELL